MSHLGSDESGKVWPPKDTRWFGVGRRNLDGTPALFPGGKGHGTTPTGSGPFLTSNTTTHTTSAPISGLAASNLQLFVANPATGNIEIYDSETLAKISAMTFTCLPTRSRRRFASRPGVSFWSPTAALPSRSTCSATWPAGHRCCGQSARRGASLQGPPARSHRYSSAIRSASESTGRETFAWHRVNWPDHQPDAGGWIWRDANGDGKFDAEEFDSTADISPTSAWSIDSRGDIWMAPYRKGPAGSFYIWKTSGPVIARFDQWSITSKRRWEIVVPFESAQVPESHHVTPDAFSVAGKRLFNGYLLNGEIRVYDTEDGCYLGALLPGPEVDRTSGWIDAMYGVLSKTDATPASGRREMHHRQRVNA